MTTFVPCSICHSLFISKVIAKIIELSQQIKSLASASGELWSSGRGDVVRATAKLRELAATAADQVGSLNKKANVNFSPSMPNAHYRVTILDGYNLLLTRNWNVPSTCRGSR